MMIRFDEIFAVTAPGLEQACAEEVGFLLDRAVDAEKGGVSFPGTLEELYRVNLWSRLASRVLVRIGEVRATDFPELYRKVKRLPWGRFVRPDAAITVRCSSRTSRLNQTRRLAQTIVDAVDGALGRAVTPAAKESQLIVARIENDTCQLSIDSSGELLYRRGYRTDISRAPLRESLAAGILSILGWDGTVPLYDPMCGSGTFLIEAAMIAANRAPGYTRSFAFERWPKFRHGLWGNLRREAERGVVRSSQILAGSDRDPAVIRAAERNLERVGLLGMARFENREIGNVEAPEDPGLVICNPPYGKRLADESSLAELYRRIGDVYSGRFAGWRKVLFCPSDDLVAATGLNFRAVAELMNGGIATRLFVCDE